ncbi:MULTISPECIES: SDR family oxidoreductase [Bacillus]|uniref:Short-chain dehydrogenase n=2 Tax=Bacillus TaxID=1386 RepID=A0A0M4G6U4_9BACI|nr:MULTISPECIES: SDR family oxidoreductase [Bacillus]ALC80658.1 short-chain dehydrogenase [Bacillus gobiensis]MBP1079543.1 NAD(P)-dependent dehydrogenase (short-subunit alcohol dehydrogenase family) [Bacillus capparidis]MED1094945.1 SDR family oxidoreductase [Bacillus capparidis]
MTKNTPKQVLPPQHQNERPGLEHVMNPTPVFDFPKKDKKLAGKTAIITGGDSGIGRAVAVLFSKEGANVAVVYLNEKEDAQKTKELVEKEGTSCLLIEGDVGDEAFCNEAAAQTKNTFGSIDILVNNAAEQHPQTGIEKITKEQLERTFRTNIFSMFFLTKAVLPHLKKGSTIINTTSITAYAGHEKLLDYSSTKGAITTFTRSLSLSLATQGIRVNGVAPGPIWTPLIPSTFTEKEVAEFGSTTPMQRPGQPAEIAPAYVYLASDDSSYVTGQVIHINGGSIVNG